MSSREGTPRRGGRGDVLSELALMPLRRLKSDGWMDALRGTYVALKAVVYLGRLQSLFQAAPREGSTARAGADPLFAISHRHFLSRRLTLAARVDCATSHFQFERLHCNAAYHRAVYGGAGLELWHAEAGDMRYSIVLRAGAEPRHEGPIGIELLAGSRRLHIVSFAWVPTQVLACGGTSAWSMFVTRNQSTRSDDDAMARFQRVFPHNAPAYFCMAALLGLAESLGQRRIAGIRDICQVAYQEAHAHSFRRSYDDFWRSFGSETATQQAHLVPVPARLPALSSVASRHRARARARRAHWAVITESSLAAMRLHVHQPRPAVRPQAAQPEAAPVGLRSLQVLGCWPDLPQMLASVLTM